MQTTPVPVRRRPVVLASGVVGAALAGFVGLALLGDKEEVCRPGPDAIRLVSESSSSGLALARASAPAVAGQAAEAAAESCARLSAAVSSNQPESDLELRETPLTPGKREAPDRTPQVRKLRRMADGILHTRLLEPLGRVKATRGSPLYGMILATARHVDASDAPAGCNLYISDGIAIEDLFGERIDLRHLEATLGERTALRELVEHLEPLRGGVVAILGAGGASNLGSERLLRAQQTFEHTMERAGITPVWSRSTDLPPRCRG